VGVSSVPSNRGGFMGPPLVTVDPWRMRGLSAVPWSHDGSGDDSSFPWRRGGFGERVLGRLEAWRVMEVFPGDAGSVAGSLCMS